MKQQVPVWLALLFLMILLVLAAAFVFLLQGRLTLADRVSELEVQETQSAENLDELALEGTVQAGIAADTEATRIALAQELDAAQDENQSLATASENAEATVSSLATAQAELEGSAAIAFFAPADGVRIKPNEPLEWIVSASDPKGIISIEVTVNGESLGSFSAEDQPLLTVMESWQPTDDGDFLFEAFYVDIDGQASDPVSLTVTVEDVAGQLADLVAEIQANVTEIRGLEANRPISLTILSTAELRERLQADFEAEVTPEEARKDVIELYAFDFIDLDFPLFDTLVDLYSESVLGFYDLETAELVVVSDDAELNAAEQLTLAHEITHALQDQNFDFDTDGLDSEAAFALRALAEGDATLLQIQYIEAGLFDFAELGEILAAESENAPDLSGIPDFLINQLSFPYVQGSTFLQYVYDDGDGDGVAGFEAVDAVWENPPLSSEQILHPDAYANGDEPQIVALPPLSDTLGVGWTRIEDNIVGEFFVREYLAQQIPTVEVELAGTGWDGDRYAIYWNESDEQVVLVWRSIWDSAEDRSEFGGAFSNYASAKYAVDATSNGAGGTCWSGEDVTCLYQLGEEALIIRAPSDAVIQAIVANIEEFAPEPAEN